MDKSSLRQYLELFYIIINEEAKVDRMISHFEICASTFARDIKAVEELAGLYGVRIIRNRHDIKAEVVDEDVYNAVYSTIKNYYNHNSSRIDQELSRAEYIIRRIIMADRYVDFDMIASEMNYSRSNIRNLLNLTRKTLEEFDLQLISSPSNGVMVSGPEFNKRLCLLNLAMNFNPDILFHNYLERDGFIQDRVERERPYDVIVDIWKNHGIEESYGSRKICSYYLLIQNIRTEAGNYIEDGYYDQSLDYLTNTREYQAAYDFYRLLSSPVKEDNNEVASLAVMFFSLENYEVRFDNEDITGLHPDMINKADRSTQIMVDVMKNKWNLEVNPEIRRMLFIVNTNIAAEGFFNLLKYKRIDLSGIGKVYKSHPLANLICNEMAERASGIHGQPIHYSHIYSLARIVFYILMNEEFNFYQKNIALCPTLTPTVIRMFIENVTDRNGRKAYNRLDLTNTIELTSKGKKDYDLIIVDSGYNGIRLSGKYENIIRIDESAQKTELDKILRSALIDTIDARSISCQQLRAYDIEERDEDKRYDRLLEILKCESIDVKEDYLKQYAGKSLIIPLLCDDDENRMIIINLKKEIRINGVSLDKIFILRYRPDVLHNKYYDQLLSGLLLNRQLLDELSKNPSIEMINNIVFSPDKYVA